MCLSTPPYPPTADGLHIFSSQGVNEFHLHQALTKILPDILEVFKHISGPSEADQTEDATGPPKVGPDVAATESTKAGGKKTVPKKAIPMVDLHPKDSSLQYFFRHMDELAVQASACKVQHKCSIMPYFALLGNSFSLLSSFSSLNP